MASFISDAIFSGLKAQFENAMIELVAKIAEGEGLDKDELMTKYLGSGPVMTTKARAPRKTKKATVTVTVDPTVEVVTKCSCTTAKGKPCMLKPLDGTTMCRIHTKKAESAGEVTTGAASGPIKEPKPKKTKKAKAKRDEPMHTHELDGETHEDCELCQTHGCPLAEEDAEEEYETVTSPPRTLRERLTRAAAMLEYVEDDDE